MWVVNKQTLQMTEGDWGIELPISIDGVELTASDEVMVTIKTEKNGETVIIKNFANISENTINLSLTEEESALLGVGTYVYSLDWYQDGAFLCNIIPAASFKVVDKA